MITLDRKTILGFFSLTLDKEPGGKLFAAVSLNNYEVGINYAWDLENVGNEALGYYAYMQKRDKKTGKWSLSMFPNRGVQ